MTLSLSWPAKALEAEVMPSARLAVWALAGLFAVEICLFTWNVDHFFNGDSLFFFSHRVHSWPEVWQKFKGPDHLWQYRPLTFVIFSFLLYPLFGLEPLGYNTFPLLLHMANTLLVYHLLRLLLADRSAALFGTFFFGVHSSAFYVTYGVAFLPDFSYSLFYLLSVLLFLKFCRGGRWSYQVASLGAFVLSLFCKEAAITLPAVLLTLTWFQEHESHYLTDVHLSLWHRLSGVVRKTSPFLVVSLAYMVFQWVSKGGQIYGAALSHPHHFELSPESLHWKYKYLKWAFNLPHGLIFEFEGWTNYLVALGVLVFALPFTSDLCKGMWQRRSEYWLGVLWFAFALSPVIFLPNLTMRHYLYVPVIGLALVMGRWLEDVHRRLTPMHLARARMILLTFILVNIGATVFHNMHAVKESWISEASRIAEKSLQQLKQQIPSFQDGTSLYIINKSHRDLPWFYDYGSLFQLFYTAKSLRVIFADSANPVPEDLLADERLVVLEYDGHELRDVSQTLRSAAAAPTR